MTAYLIAVAIIGIVIILIAAKLCMTAQIDARDIETRLADRNDMAAEVFDAFMIDTAGVEYAPDKNLRDHDH